MSFTNCTIRELFLDNNELKEFPTEALQNLINLAILRLDNNPIIRLDAGDISNLPSLLQISLSNMPQLQTVQSSAFNNLPQLLKVDLYQNGKLLYIAGDAFKNCVNVKVLHLHACGLRGLDSSVLHHLPRLTNMSFYDNPVHCNCLAQWIVQSNLTLIDGQRIACATPHAVHDTALATLTEEQFSTDCYPLVMTMPTEQVVDFGTDVKLTCNAIGPNSITWLKPSHAEINSTTILLQSANHNDEGVYTCIATSETNASDSESTYLRVVHTLILVTPSKISQTFIDLSWNDTSGSKYLTYVEAEGAKVKVNIPDGLTEININNLQCDTVYVFCLYYHHNTEYVCVTAKTLALQRDDILEVPQMKLEESHQPTQTVIIVLVIVSSVSAIVGIALVSYKKCQRYTKAKVLYKRYRNENNLLGSTSHIKLDQCYNPTTEPLCIEEPT